jgi:hypothetical protein
MISRDDVLEVAKYLKILPIPEKQYAFCMVEYNRMADQDPTGNPDVWIEQLLEEYDEYAEELIDGMIDNLVEALKSGYAIGEVTSGEWILGQQIPTHDKDNNQHTLFTVQSAVNKFLEWDCEDDGNYNTVGAYLVGANCTTNHDGDYWAIEEFETITYDGKYYPARVLEVTIDEHDDGWAHFYKIAPESLLDAMQELEGDEATEAEGEAQEVDYEIYHYVEDVIFYETEEYIAKHGLDTPMTIVKEV